MKILIIKLGADGDVVRTMPIARALKEKFQRCEIIWVTKGDVSELLAGNPCIDRVFTIPFKTNEKFDALYNFDVDKEATALATEIKADKKYGFYADGDYPAAFNAGAEYYLNTMFDDELKRSNKKTYQEMMFDAAELKYNRENCPIVLNEKEKEYAKEFARKNGLAGKKIIGIHMGASSRWPSKVWHESRIKDLIEKAKKKGYEIILFGGPNEVGKHEKLAAELERKGIKIHRNNVHNTKREFAALVNICDWMICSDSFALHISLALGKRTVGLFFCTSADEVEGYGLLKKIVSHMHKEFFPERMDECSEELMNSISADEVLDAIK